jgi:hypothetical protein
MHTCTQPILSPDSHHIESLNTLEHGEKHLEPRTTTFFTHCVDFVCHNKPDFPKATLRIK